METSTEISKKERLLHALKGHEHTSDSHPKIAERFDIAQKALEGIDFPTTRDEDWKYTRVGKIINRDWTLQPSEAEVNAQDYTIPGLECHQLVFVNGYYRSDLSSPITGELTAVTMGEGKDSHREAFDKVFGSLAEDDKSIFTALNSSYATGGAFIHLAKGAKSDKPVHLVFLHDADGSIAQPRNLIVVEDNAELDIIQSIITTKDIATFSNTVTEIHLGQNARLNIDKIQSGTEGALVNCYEKGVQHRDSHFRLNTFTLSGGWTRNTSEMAVRGENSTTDYYGTYMPTGKSHVDNHTMIDHIAANCQSNELYKGIIYDAATGVFNGKVFVRQDAQKIDAFQQNANIVMTENGKMNSKPELEIYADDVKCSHGSTTGQFDEEALFYLMSRGIGREKAKRLLVTAFIADVMDKTSHEAVKDYLLSRIGEE